MWVNCSSEGVEISRAFLGSDKNLPTYSAPSCSSPRSLRNKPGINGSLLFPLGPLWHQIVTALHSALLPRRGRDRWCHICWLLGTPCPAQPLARGAGNAAPAALPGLPPGKMVQSRNFPGFSFLLCFLLTPLIKWESWSVHLAVLLFSCGGYRWLEDDSWAKSW